MPKKSVKTPVAAKSVKTPVKKKVTTETPKAEKKAPASNADQRNKSLHGHPASSLRGIGRNLRLEGYGELWVKRHGKDRSFFVFRTKAAAKPILKSKAIANPDSGDPVKSITELTYGQWVTQSVKAASLKKAK